MTKGNIIDLALYRKKRDAQSKPPISDELKHAIQTLIQRLRELGPIPKAK